MTKTSETTSNVPALIQEGKSAVPKLLEQVQAKIKELTGSAKPDSTTKGKDLPGFGPVEKIDKVSTLIQAYSSVKNRALKYDEVAKELDISTVKFPFKLGGCTSKQWLNTIANRINRLKNKAELDKLREIEKTLEENLSAEDKFKKDMMRISGILTDESPLE